MLTPPSPQLVEEQRVMIITEPLQEYERRLGRKIWEEEGEEGEGSRRDRKRGREEEEEERTPALERLGEKRRRRSVEQERGRRSEEEGMRGRRSEEDGCRVDVRARLGGRERSPPRERINVKERLGVPVGRGEGEERYRGRGRGGYRGRGRGGRSHYHDKYAQGQEEPSSTTDLV